jgi:hypothetical protein
MKNTFKNGFAFMGVAVLAFPLIGAIGPPGAGIHEGGAVFGPATPSTPAQEQATVLLKQVATRARATADRAETLESYARGRQVDIQAHAHELNRAKDSINAMGADLSELQELHTDALPWQQMLINRLEPMLSSLADHTTVAIGHLNENPGTLYTTEYMEYRDAVGNMSAHADEVSDVISVNVDYAKARGKLERLNARPTDDVS